MSNAELLAELIAAAGLAPDALAGRSYLCNDSDSFLVPLHEVWLFTRPILERSKLEAILDAIAKGVALPPIVVAYRYRLRNGHHRLAVSSALGAASVPCTYRRR